MRRVSSVDGLSHVLIHDVVIDCFLYYFLFEHFLLSIRC